MNPHGSQKNREPIFRWEKYLSFARSFSLKKGKEEQQLNILRKKVFLDGIIKYLHIYLNMAI